MANSNTLTEVIPRLLAQGMLALRQMAIMPRYVNRSYETIAGEKGSSIDVPIPSAITAVAVTPSYVPPDDTGVVPTKISVALDEWWEAPFFLSDKDMLEAMNGTIPMQASEAIKSIANKVDNLLIVKAAKVFQNYTGVAGTTPFATDLSEFLTADQLLNDTLTPGDNRYVALSSRAKANAMGLRAFQDSAWRGDTTGIIKGEIGEKMGAFWFMDQNLTRPAVGTITTGLIAKAATAVVAGLKTFVATTAAATGACALVVGDHISIAGHTQVYVLTATATQASAASDVTLTFEPGLEIALAGSEAVTVKAIHRNNFLFHRDALALASRPFAGADPMGLGTFQSAVDPISGLALRLEVTRQHKRTRWSYDILCGVGAPRPQFGVVIAGE